MSGDRSGPLERVEAIGRAVSGRLLGPLRRRYAVKFVVGLLAVVVVIALVGTGTYLRTTSTIESDVEQQLRTTAELKAASLSQWIAGLQGNARMISENNVLRTSTSQFELTRELERAETRLLSDHIEGIHIVDTATDRVLASTVYEIGTRPSLSEVTQHWARGLQGEVRFPSSDIAVTGSEVFRSARLDRDHLVWVASPVTRAPNRKLVVVADVGSFLEGHTGDAHEVTVFNSDQEPILVTAAGAVDGPGSMDRGGYDPGLVEATFGDGDTRFDRREETTSAYALVETVSWVVVTSMPAREAFAVRETIGRSVLGLVVSAVLALGVVGFVLGRLTVPPLVDLREKAERIEDGEFAVDLRTTRQDEIGELFESFERMRDSLVAYIDDVEQHNEQLRVMDRLLRHNLKNDATAITLYAEYARKQADDDLEEIDAIIAKVEEMVRRADKQRLITQTLSPATDPVPTDLVDHVQEAARLTAANHPHANIRVDVPESALAMVTPSIHDAIVELLENAVVHSDRDSPAVEVSVVERGSTVAVVVSDDGPPIPANDREILFERREPTELNHATGVGLWLVRWVVTSAGGTLSHEPNEPRGNRVTLELEAAP